MSTEQEVARRGSCIGGILSAVTWSIAAPLTLAAVVHLGTDDSNFWAQLLHAASAWLYAPALPLLFVAAVRRRTAQASALLLVAGMWGWMHRPPIGLREPVSEGPTLRMVSANALMVNATPEVWVAGILADQPDLVLVQELTPAVDALISEALPYRHAEPAWHSFGIGAYSRWPLHEATLISLEPVDMQRLVVDVDGTSVMVWNVHTMPPFDPQKHAQWRRQILTLAEESSKVSGPLVLAGDLNLTRHHQGYVDLSRPLTDAYRDCGRWMAWTWPNHGPFSALFPKLRLDHVFLANGARCAHIEEGAGYGSDHRPIRVDVRLP